MDNLVVYFVYLLAGDLSQINKVHIINTLDIL
jgi:hypothetical protein